MKHKYKVGSIVKCTCGSDCIFHKIWFIIVNIDYNGENWYSAESLYKVKINEHNNYYNYDVSGEFKASTFLFDEMKLIQ